MKDRTWPAQKAFLNTYETVILPPPVQHIHADQKRLRKPYTMYTRAGTLTPAGRLRVDVAPLTQYNWQGRGTLCTGNLEKFVPPLSRVVGFALA